MYDPNNLDINQYPCWDNYDEALSELKAKSAVQEVKPKVFAKVNVIYAGILNNKIEGVELIETNFGTRAVSTKTNLEMGYNHGFYSNGTMLEEDFEIIK